MTGFAAKTRTYRQGLSQYQEKFHFFEKCIWRLCLRVLRSGTSLKGGSYDSENYCQLNTTEACRQQHPTQRVLWAVGSDDSLWTMPPLCIRKRRFAWRIYCERIA